mgnify:FL=1
MRDYYCKDCQKLTSGDCGKHELTWRYDSRTKNWEKNIGGVAAESGIKHDNEKLRLDLLPFDALMEVAEVYSMGAKKYSDRNWEKGLSYMRVVGALLRHLFAWILGEERATDDKQRHLASVVWCGLALLTYELREMKEFDDRPIK